MAVRIRNVMTDIRDYNIHRLYRSKNPKVIFMEDLTSKYFLKYEGAGKGAWQELEELRNN
jgi:hypothetical protein